MLESGGVPTTISETMDEDLLLSKHTGIKRKKKDQTVDQDVRGSSKKLCEHLRPTSENEELRKFMPLCIPFHGSGSFWVMS